MEEIKKRPNPFEKRTNPFDRKAPVAAEPVEKEEVEEAEEEVYEEQRVEVQPKVQPKVKQPARPVRYVPQEEPKREKYTATMDEQLRRRIKIYCATYGVMFSDFIERACEEKLKKERE